eukprot:TRINITY_DN8935_c0_g1_i2.p2 TRINITY_DN8935_c0_g1~~TRINITY_DN8935_c0_g1_i2.p2  ORF type:complete len:155 (+),score=10.11 TRINITY_DN8935_c0_g1_i2:477-941(+)
MHDANSSSHIEHHMQECTSDVLFELDKMRIILEVKEDMNSTKPLCNNKVAAKRYLQELLSSDHLLKELNEKSSIAPLHRSALRGDVKLPSWRETKTALAQVKVPICRAVSAPDLLCGCFKHKPNKESVAVKKLWSYIVRPVSYTHLTLPTIYSV